MSRRWWVVVALVAVAALWRALAPLHGLYSYLRAYRQETMP